MSQQARFDRFEHPSWGTAVGTALGYVAILLVMFVLLFVVPYGLFVVLTPM